MSHRILKGEWQGLFEAGKEVNLSHFPVSYVSGVTLTTYTHLRDVDLRVRDRAALDRLGRLLDDALDEDDALHAQAARPLDHLLRNLARPDRHERLHGVEALAEHEEDHLTALRAAGVHARTEEDGLAIVHGGERRDLRALLARPCLGLMQRKLAIEFGGKVLGAVVRSLQRPRRRIIRTTSAASF
jgi:hypothetical protein